MKRLTDEEKRQLGLLIYYYRNQYFRSRNKNAELYKQTEFCKNICSQAQLSRIENGEVIKDQEIYDLLLEKLNLSLEKVNSKELIFFDAYIDNLLKFRNTDTLIVNYNEYLNIIDDYQQIFKDNIIYTHYNYALEFILTVLYEDVEEATNLLEGIELNLEILPPKLLILTLQALGSYYQMLNNNKANKFYLLTLEHMHKTGINNPIIYLDIAYNYLTLGKYFNSLDNLHIALSLFEDTDYNSILETIYRYYGLIYLRNRYYDDSLKAFKTAITYCEDKLTSLATIYVYISLCFYFQGEINKAIEWIDKSESVITSEKTKLFKAIYRYKQSKVKEDKVFLNNDYNLILKLYYSDKDLEEFFEVRIKNIITKFSDDLKTMILKDVYDQYKTENKYKKALYHFETYMIY